MRLHRIILAGVSLALVLAPLSARASESGPDYVASSPSDGETRPTAPDEVWITFTMPLDQSSILRVVNECKERVDNGNITIIGNRISVGLKANPSGSYEAHWQVRAPSGATGDGVGVLRFEVTNGESCGDGGRHHHGGGGGDKKDDHGGHGKDDKKNHEGHDSGGGGGHSDGHSSSSGHSSSGTHSGSGHTMSDDDHSMGKGGHAGHKKGKGKGKHAGHRDESEAASRDIAAPGAPELPSVAGSDVLMALMICMLVGTAGGYVVRKGWSL